MEKFASHAAADLSQEVDLAVVKSESPDAATVAAVEALGGIGRFVKSGDVVVIKPGWGNVISIRHAGDIVSWYGYLDRILIREGQKIRKGQRIGTVGSSGAAAAPELAVRFFRNERPTDPLPLLP